MDYVSIVKDKYSHLSSSVCNLYVDRAKSIMIEQVYPADFSISYDTYVVPSRFDMWILDCVDELVAKDGINTATGYANSYSENNLKFTWKTTGISDDLKQRLTRIVGAVK